MRKLDFDEALIAKATALGPLIREHAAEMERQRRPPRPLVDALAQSRLAHMLLPKSLGGLETDPLTCMRVVEVVASFDASAAWLLMVTNANAWANARLPASTVEEIFRNLDDCVQATGFQPPTQAIEVEGGFRVTGRVPLASGAHVARFIGCTAMVMDGAQPRMMHGMPVMVGVTVPAERVQVVDTWHGLGLRGSDSADISLQDVFVPSDWTFAVSPVFEPNQHYRSPLYKLPMLAAIPYAQIAPIALAIARNAIDAARAHAAKRVPLGSTVPVRDRGAAQEKLGRAEAAVRAARVLLYDTMADAWQRIVAGETLTLQDKADLLLAATHTVQSCSEATDLMFAIGGSSAVYETNPLARLFRDINVIRHHGFVCAARYETAAQVALGLEPDLPLLHF